MLASPVHCDQNSTNGVPDRRYEHAACHRNYYRIVWLPGNWLLPLNARQISVRIAPTKIAETSKRIRTRRSDVVFKESLATMRREAKRRIDAPQCTAGRANGVHELRCAWIVHPVPAGIVSSRTSGREENRLNEEVMNLRRSGRADSLHSVHEKYPGCITGLHHCLCVF